MPSTSAAQHRLIGYWHSHPDARPKSMSAGQVDEWLHADRGSPWTHHADGGAVRLAVHHAREAARAQRDPAQRDPAQRDQTQRDPAHRDMGGYTPPSVAGINYEERANMRGEAALPQGLIHSPVAGRTDQLPMSPAAGSYVLPADVVSGLGEGNTLAGARVIDQMLGSQPYGIRPAQHRGRDTIPRAPAPPRQAHGGAVIHAQPGHDPHEGRPGSVPIVAAGGEYVVPANTVAYHPALGMGDPNNPDPKHRKAALTRGHAILDSFVKHVRGKTVKTLQKLPGPAK